MHIFTNLQSLSDGVAAITINAKVFRQYTNVAPQFSVSLAWEDQSQPGSSTPVVSTDL
jgi:hypothetical protein